MSWLLTFVLAGSVSYGPDVSAMGSPTIAPPIVTKTAQDLLAAESRRIRSSEKRLNMLLADGVRRSRSFADLVARLHNTDVIVYVETSHDLTSDTLGRILMQTIAGGQRYLRIQVRAMMPGDHVIAVLAHELHHALEVAGDKSVVDELSLAGLYRRIGHSSYGVRGFDSDGARAAGIRVRDELIVRQISRS
jgi:hypothetical protein